MGLLRPESHAATVFTALQSGDPVLAVGVGSVWRVEDEDLWLRAEV